MQIAVVATARKLAVLCWHLVVKGEDYAFGPNHKGEEQGSGGLYPDGHRAERGP